DQLAGRRAESGPAQDLDDRVLVDRVRGRLPDQLVLERPGVLVERDVVEAGERVTLRSDDQPGVLGTGQRGKILWRRLNVPLHVAGTGLDLLLDAVGGQPLGMVTLLT